MRHTQNNTKKSVTTHCAVGIMNVVGLREKCYFRAFFPSLTSLDDEWEKTRVVIEKVFPLWLSTDVIVFSMRVHVYVRHKADFLPPPSTRKYPYHQSLFYAVRITNDEKYKYYSIFPSTLMALKCMCTHLFFEECDHKGLRWIKGDWGCLLSLLRINLLFSRNFQALFAVFLKIIRIWNMVLNIIPWEVTRKI
jgi:hypothetical protein